MAFICFFFIFFQNKRFTVRLPDLSTSFTQPAVFTNPDEQKPSKSELCQTCTRAKREMHQHLAAMACTRMQSIKYCWKEGKYHQALQGEAFGFCSSPQSLCIILRNRATDTLTVCSLNWKVTSCKTIQKLWDTRTASYLSLKQRLSYFYLDCSSLYEKSLSSANFKEI